MTLVYKFLPPQQWVCRHLHSGLRGGGTSHGSWKIKRTSREPSEEGKVIPGREEQHLQKHRGSNSRLDLGRAQEFNMAQVHNECWVLAVRKQAGEVGWIQRRVLQVNLRLRGGGRAATQMAMNTSHVKDPLLTWGMCNCWYVFSRLRHRRLPSTSNSPIP